MANTKITAMVPAAVPLTGGEAIPIVQGGVNKKASVFQVTAATYGEIYVVGGAVAQTLTTADTFYKVTAFATDGLSNNMTPLAASDGVQVDVAGNYLIQFFITFSNSNNKTFSFRCYNETTATAYPNTLVKSHSHSTDPMFIAVSAFVHADVGDVLIVQAACNTGGAAITVSDGNMAILLLKAD